MLSLVFGSRFRTKGHYDALDVEFAELLGLEFGFVILDEGIFKVEAVCNLTSRCSA